MPKQKRSLNLFAMLGLFASTVAAPGYAMSINAEEPSDNWRVERFKLYEFERCRLSKVAEEGGPELVLTGIPVDLLSYRLRFAEPVTTDDTRYAMMQIGDWSHRLQITNYGTQLQMAGFGRKFLAAFLVNDAMVITVNDETVVTVDLDGSAAAYEELQSCIADLPPEAVIPPPTASPSTSSSIDDDQN